MKKGMFITFEGPDGAGKTTVATAVFKYLKDHGVDCIYTREPGGIEIAEQIRSVILNPENKAMDAKTEALLYAASRRQHLVEKVIPALNANKLVICDRFVDSSLAYQGYGRKLGFDTIYELNKFAIDDYFPDLTIFLDIDEEAGLKRIATRSNKDRLDMESINFHHLVKEGYNEVLKRFKDRIFVVNAEQEVDNVVKDCLEVILRVVE